MTHLSAKMARLLRALLRSAPTRSTVKSEHPMRRAGASVARRHEVTSGRTEEFYEGNRDTVLSTAGIGETMQEVLARRWSRRGLVKGGLAAGLVLTAAGRDLRAAGAQDATPVTGEAAQVGGLAFVPITLDAGDEIVVATGHTAVPFLRWGDPIMADAPAWDLDNQSAAGPRAAVRLQLRLDRVLSLTGGLGQLGPRAARRQPRVHQPRADVPWLPDQEPRI